MWVGFGMKFIFNTPNWLSTLHVIPEVCVLFILSFLLSYRRKGAPDVQRDSPWWPLSPGRI